MNIKIKWENKTDNLSQVLFNNMNNWVGHSRKDLSTKNENIWNAENPD